MENNIKVLLGKRIKELRNKRGFTQEFLAEKIGVGQRNLSKIECGNNFVTADTLQKIINAFEISAKELFDFEHNQSKEVLKKELINAINEEKIDIKLLYNFYEALK